MNQSLVCQEEWFTASAVGLTAYVTKDPETRQLVLQTRALVLADNGVCCIEELDKMNDSTRSVLHDVMEQQTLYIAKAGIICQLNTRTSILAAANLINSKWDPKSTITENIQLPPTLMSSFDLVFLIILDPQDEQYDKKLARHYRDQSQAEEDSFSMTVLRDNLKYAKQTFKPVPKMALQELLSKKTKTPTVSYDRLFSEFKGNSDIQITREM